MKLLQSPFNTWRVVFALYYIGSMMKGFVTANQVDVTMLSLSHDSVSIKVDVADNTGAAQTGWTMAAPTVTEAGSNLATLPTQTPAAGTAGDSHTLVYSTGLKPAAAYVITFGTVTDSGSTAVTAGAKGISFCTSAAPIMGLEVDDEGTTASAIKIKWTAPTEAVAFEAYLGSTKIGDINSGATTEFTFENSDGASAALEADTDYTCTVKSAATPCGGETYQAEASVACKVTSASGDDDDDDDDEKCNAVTEKLATWMFVLSASIFFSMKKITSA